MRGFTIYQQQESFKSFLTEIRVLSFQKVWVYTRIKVGIFLLYS